jgi:hypothetical protein
MIRLSRVLGAAALASIAALPALAQSPAPTRDRVFWRALAAGKFAVPAGDSATGLARELSALLASPDPELRDDIAYTGLVSLIYRQRAVPPEAIRELTTEWRRNLTVGLGEQGTDAVFRRSFSALSLGIVAALDNEAPFLDRAGFDRLLASALEYLSGERDLRGFDPGTGWMHAVAHTADLLKFLARSRHLQPAQQTAILDGIAGKLRTVDEVLTHGEDERLARAVVAIVARADFDRAAFERWLTALAPARSTAPPSPASLAGLQNRRNLVVSLHAVLTTDARDLAGLDAARSVVRAALKKFVQ